jgi:hypothetical protein
MFLKYCLSTMILLILEYSDSFSGALWMEYNNEPYVTLEHAFHEVFDAGNYKACLLTIGANTVAVLMPFPDVLKVFDSYSRDMHGMPAAVGYSVLVSFEGIQNLTRFFHNSCNYPGQNSENSQFELKGVKCHRNISLSNSLDNTANDDTTSNNRDQLTKQQESVIERENRLAKLREKQREKRQQAKQKESVAERENRLAKQTEKRKQETVSEREYRLAKQGEKRKQAKQQETVTERENRLAKQRQKSKQVKQQETVSERENRLQNQRKAGRLKRQNETVEQREQRLAKVRANYKKNKSRRSGKNKQCPRSGSRGHVNNDRCGSRIFQT